MIITFLSDKIIDRFPTFFGAIFTISRRENAFVRILEGTKDIWIRDYMPILLPSGKMIQFQYNPSYLKNGFEHLRTESGLIEKQFGFPLSKSKVVMDGGNYVRFGDKVLVCDRLFSENQHIHKEELLNQLRYMFQASEIVVLPTHPYDPVGHADGIVANTDRNFVIIEEIPKRATTTEINFHRKLRKVLDEHNIAFKEIFNDLPADGYINEWDNRGSYLNFTFIGNTLLLPVYKNTDTYRLMNCFIPLFPKKSIWMINCEELAKEGGAIHCATWTA